VSGRKLQNFSGFCKPCQSTNSLAIQAKSELFNSSIFQLGHITPGGTGGVFPLPLFERLNYLKNLIYDKQLKGLRRQQRLEQSLRNLKNLSARFSRYLSSCWTSPYLFRFGRMPRPRPDANFAPTARTLRRLRCLHHRRCRTTNPMN
jgi:hypothetical protein